MNKNIIYVILGVVVILVVAATIKLAQESREEGDIRDSAVYDEVNEAGRLSDGMIGITATNFDEVITDSNGIVVVDFFAPSCSFCVKYAPIFAEVFEEYKDRAVFGKIDVTRASEKVVDLNIAGTPETIIFKDGEVANRVGGFVEADRLKAEIDKVLSE